MKKSIITVIVGAVITLSGIGMGVANIPNWGWVFGLGIIFIIIGNEIDG
jgi:hypothetical protein